MYKFGPRGMLSRILAAFLRYNYGNELELFSRKRQLAVVKYYVQDFWHYDPLALEGPVISIPSDTSTEISSDSLTWISRLTHNLNKNQK